MSSTKRWAVALAIALLGAGCGDDDAADTDAGMNDAAMTGPDATSNGGAGSLTVLLEAEETITEGLMAGEEDENILDGWSMTFDKYIVTVGDIDLTFATDDSKTAEAGDVYVVDLTEVPPAGLELWTFGELDEGRWEFGYSTPGAGDGAMRHESVSEEDFMEMASGDLTYLIEGTMTKADGESCPPPSGTCMANPTISFRLAVPAETVFGPCQAEDGAAGVAIGAGSQAAAITIHGDHVVFNGFPEGEEGGVMRLAQWLADCDLDVDGTVTKEELEMIDPADLAELDDRFDLGGSPIDPLNNMWEYLQGQLKTQGHFQGEGECPFDGMAHED